jgi:hypothetical protein
MLRGPATFGEFKLTDRTGDILLPHVEAVGQIYRELGDSCAAILDGATPRSPAELGAGVVPTIEALDDALANTRGAAELEPAVPYA